MKRIKLIKDKSIIIILGIFFSLMLLLVNCSLWAHNLSDKEQILLILSKTFNINDFSVEGNIRCYDTDYKDNLSIDMTYKGQITRTFKKVEICLNAPVITYYEDEEAITINSTINNFPELSFDKNEKSQLNLKNFLNIDNLVIKSKKNIPIKIKGEQDLSYNILADYYCVDVKDGFIQYYNDKLDKSYDNIFTDSIGKISSMELEIFCDKEPVIRQFILTLKVDKMIIEIDGDIY